MKKKILTITLATLTLCTILSACGGSGEENADQTSSPVSSSAEETEDKLVAGTLEQNSIETSSREHWVQEKGNGVVTQHIEYKPFSSLNTMLMELNAGRVDYLRVSSSVGNYLAANDDKLIIKTRENHLQHYHMAARTEDTALCDEINSAIDALKADGTLEQLATDYITNADSAPAVNELEKHEGGKTYVVAVTGDLPPMDYVSTDGTPAGFNVALLNAISEKSDCNFEIVQMDANARLSALESGKIDLIFWIGCTSNEGFEPETDKVTLSSAYFEESACYVSYSEDVLEKAMSFYQSTK